MEYEFKKSLFDIWETLALTCAVFIVKCFVFDFGPDCHIELSLVILSFIFVFEKVFETMIWALNNRHAPKSKTFSKSSVDPSRTTIA